MADYHQEPERDAASMILDQLHKDLERVTTDLEDQTSTIGRLQSLRDHYYNLSMTGRADALEAYLKIEARLGELLAEGKLFKAEFKKGVNGMIKVAGSPRAITGQIVLGHGYSGR